MSLIKRLWLWDKLFAEDFLEGAHKPFAPLAYTLGGKVNPLGFELAGYLCITSWFGIILAYIPKIEQD